MRLLKKKKATCMYCLKKCSPFSGLSKHKDCGNRRTRSYINSRETPQMQGIKLELGFVQYHEVFNERYLTDDQTFPTCHGVKLQWQQTRANEGITSTRTICLGTGGLLKRLCTCHKRKWIH